MAEGKQLGSQMRHRMKSLALWLPWDLTAIMNSAFPLHIVLKKKFSGAKAYMCFPSPNRDGISNSDYSFLFQWNIVVFRVKYSLSEVI